MIIMNLNVSLKLRIGLDHNDFSVEFPSREFFYALLWTTMSEADIVNTEVKPYTAITAAFDPRIASSSEALTCIHNTELLVAKVKTGYMTPLELC